MSYKNKRDNKKPLSVALGVILALAPGAVIIDNLEPVPVYADAGELAGLTDYLYAGMSLDSSGAPSPAWNVNGFAAYVSGLWAVRECLRHPVSGRTYTIDSISSVSGKFYYQGTVYPCVSFSVANGDYNYDEGAFTLFSSPLFDITYQIFPNDQDYSYTYDIVATMNTSGSTYLGVAVVRKKDGSNTSFRGIREVRGGNVFDPWISNYSTGSTVTVTNYLRIDSTGIPDLNPSQGLGYYFARTTGYTHPIAGSGIRTTFPGGSGTPVTLDYIQDVYTPWYVQTYPDIEPFIYSPYSPEFPDPSDAYPGIPKDWTIKNPQLPTSPSIGLNAYKPDLSEMNPSESIMEYDTGFDFWWWLTNQALTHTNTKTIVLLAILLGLVGYLLWHLGGHI